ncbi:AtpZ/AtpI family protein [Leeuwenhoekiella parthenopeia]|uniref:AtpZ/AtpI family protein n=1 Tax=Leeuwenhoekiella parthenopeia TaxID=2890320 RepID=A0ABS8GQB4_9FLAO|nr:AtpZ/AtpI family protein [Leeuwenhoekiella parthenopeia]MCC4212160.1 AtpZ/AtpI family protein [Leeuwenhoekiella parthenopeia]
MSNKKPESPLKSWAKFSTIAIQMGLTIYLGNLLGEWLDRKFETQFLEPLVSLLAVFLSMYVIIRAVKSLNS